MAAIEFLIYSHRGLAGSGYSLLLQGNDSTVTPQASCYNIVLLKESVGQARKTRRAGHVLALVLK